MLEKAGSQFHSDLEMQVEPDALLKALREQYDNFKFERNELIAKPRERTGGFGALVAYMMPKGKKPTDMKQFQAIDQVLGYNYGKKAWTGQLSPRRRAWPRTSSRATSPTWSSSTS